MTTSKVFFLALVLVGAESELNNVCCPIGWLGFNGYCYRHFTYKVTWHAARDHCLSLGADLTSIHSSVENSIINGLVAGEKIWIGTTDEDVEGEFGWNDGTSFTFSNWKSGEPAGGVGENCAGMNWPSIPAGTWHDLSCSIEQQYVCKK